MLAVGEDVQGTRVGVPQRDASGWRAQRVGCPALELLHDVADVGQASQAADARQKSAYFRLLPDAPQPGGWSERDEVTRSDARPSAAPSSSQAGGRPGTATFTPATARVRSRLSEPAAAA